MKVSFTDTFEDKWFDYSRKVYADVDVSEVQYRETRLAFYAGSWVAFNTILKLAEADENVAVKAMSMLLEDLTNFLEKECKFTPGVLNEEREAEAEC